MCAYKVRWTFLSSCSLCKFFGLVSLAMIGKLTSLFSRLYVVCCCRISFFRVSSLVSSARLLAIVSRLCLI